MSLPTGIADCITSLGARITATAQASSWGIGAGQLYFPRFPGVSTLPACVLERTATRYSRWTNSGNKVVFTLSAQIILSAAAYSDAQVETGAELIADELVGPPGTDGLFILGVEVGRSCAPGPGMFPASDPGQIEAASKLIRCIMLTVDAGEP